MNQIQILRFIQFNYRRTRISLAVLPLLLIAHLPAFGQQFQSTMDQSFPGNWQNPNSNATAATATTANHESPVTWPDKFVTFDSHVKPTGFDEKSESLGRVASAIDSTGATLSQLKNVVASKANGWLKQDPEKQDGGVGLNIPKMLGSLAIVLGCYFGFVWLMRKISPASNAQLPKEVVQILGRTSFGARQHLQLVRLGSKLVLLLNGPDGTHPIGEVTNSDEVRHLISLCSPRNAVRPSFFDRTTTQPTRQSPPANDSDNPSSSGLANILRSLEQVAKKHGGSVFEA